MEFILVRTLRRESDAAIVTEEQVAPIGDNIYRPLLSGFREGDDARDVLSDAIEWWEVELAEIAGAAADKRIRR